MGRFKNDLLGPPPHGGPPPAWPPPPGGGGGRGGAPQGVGNTARGGGSHLTESATPYPALSRWERERRRNINDKPRSCCIQPLSTSWSRRRAAPAAVSSATSARSRICKYR